MKKIVGIDEAGRGALAGPLVAAAVCIVRPALFPFDLVKDSKLLTDQARREYAPRIRASCAYRLSIVSHRLIDRIGIQAANVLAVDYAVSFFRESFYEIHSDYIGGFDQYTAYPDTIRLHVRGESLFPEIAAASILAKVFRDDIMARLSRVYPEYGFEKNKGYGTLAHRVNLRKHRASLVHRATFRPVLSFRKQGL